MSRAEMENAAAPRRWAPGLGAALKALGSAVLPGASCLAMALAAYFAIAAVNTGPAMLGPVLWPVALGVMWIPARYVWRFCSRVWPLPESSLLSELRLVLVVAALGAVPVLAVAPSFAGLMRHDNEAYMRADLHLVRESVESYKKSHGGRPPPSIEALLADGTLYYKPRLWRSFTKTPHPDGFAAEIVASGEPTDSGRLAYVVSASSPDLTGTVFINCTHTDARGSAWYSY